MRIPILLDEAELMEGMNRLIRAWEEYTQMSRCRDVLQAIT